MTTLSSSPLATSQMHFRMQQWKASGLALILPMGDNPEWYWSSRPRLVGRHRQVSMESSRPSRLTTDAETGPHALHTTTTTLLPSAMKLLQAFLVLAKSLSHITLLVGVSWWNVGDGMWCFCAQWLSGTYHRRISPAQHPAPAAQPPVSGTLATGRQVPSPRCLNHDSLGSQCLSPQQHLRVFTSESETQGITTATEATQRRYCLRGVVSQRVFSRDK